MIASIKMLMCLLDRPRGFSLLYFLIGDWILGCSLLSSTKVAYSEHSKSVSIFNIIMVYLTYNKYNLKHLVYIYIYYVCSARSVNTHDLLIESTYFTNVWTWPWNFLNFFCYICKSSYSLIYKSSRHIYPD